MQIELPESLATKLDKEDVLLDLAVGMYAGRRLTLGQAAKLARVPQGAFQKVLGLRQVPAHYDMDDLAADLQAAADMARG
jgi:predicted HTH domain antitoxin